MPSAARDVDGLQHALALGEAAEEQQVVVAARPRNGNAATSMACGTTPTTLRPVIRPRLRVRDGDERRVGIVARPQRHLAGAGRVMQRLHQRHAGQTAERQRQRVVLGLVVDDVERRGPLDGGRQVEQLAQLPRPDRRVLAVAARERGVQRGAGARLAGREERHVVAARPRGRRSAAPSSISIEPDSGGGTDVATGATWAMRSGAVIAPAVSRRRGSTRPASK